MSRLGFANLFHEQMKTSEFAKAPSPRRFASFVPAVLAMVLAVAFAVPVAAAKKIIIDTDPGTDDAMHVDVETRGEFTRGETVANRRGAVERNVLHGDRYVIEGVDLVKPNTKVCVDVDSDRFLRLFVSRIGGK